MDLFVVRKESLAKERKDDFGFTGTNFAEVETLFCTDNPLQESLLFRSGHNLAFTVYKSLISCEVITESINEVIQRKISMLVKIKELRRYD